MRNSHSRTFQFESGHVIVYTAWELSKHGVFSSLHFPVFGLNKETYRVNLRIQKYGLEKTLHLDNFHAVLVVDFFLVFMFRYSIKLKKSKKFKIACSASVLLIEGENPG